RPSRYPGLGEYPVKITARNDVTIAFGAGAGADFGGGGVFDSLAAGGDAQQPYGNYESPSTAYAKNTLRLKRRHRKDAPLYLARVPRNRHIDRLTVCRSGDAIETDMVCRDRTAVDTDAADLYHVALLTHPDDRVVASIGNVEV